MSMLDFTSHLTCTPTICVWSSHCLSLIWWGSGPPRFLSSFRFRACRGYARPATAAIFNGSIPTVPLTPRVSSCHPLSCGLDTAMLRLFGHSLLSKEAHPVLQYVYRIDIFRVGNIKTNALFVSTCIYTDHRRYDKTATTPG